MSSGPLEIAIVGMGTAFPGDDGLEGFWRTIEGAVDTAREVPRDRWAIPREVVHDPEGPKPDHVYSLRGCFVERSLLDSDEQEALNRLRAGELPSRSPDAGREQQLSSALLGNLDPVFHLALRAGLRAWHDGRLDRLSSATRGRSAVILGNIVLPTEKASELALELLGRARRPVHPLNRYPAGLPAAVLANALGLHGPAFTLDAACASSLYSLAIAARELERGRIDLALAGGISRPDCLYTQMGFSQLRALSPTGRCSPFDSKADGLVVGEGAGILVLKRLGDALRDGDRIVAVIRAVGLSNDIAGSLMSPASEGQLRAMHAAHRRAGWRPEDLDLIECHGTGTPVGDAVELSSLETLWRETGARVDPLRRCVVGSVKSNVGHLLTAAGAAGVIKVILALRNKQLPPTANSRQPLNALEASKAFRILSLPLPWSRRDAATPRRAAVSAFGFGGINAHLLLEEWDESLPTARLKGRSAEPPGAAFAEPWVAIVGMDTHFGAATSLEAFRQRVLRSTEDDLEPTPEGPPLGSIEIDWTRFRIPPRELAETLPQQLLMLKVAAGALDDAGLKNPDRMGIGVFIGIALDLNTTNFHARWCASPSERDLVHPPLTANRTMGALGGIVASRIARWLQAGGPSFTLSSEETSGLRALETAVRALQAGDVSIAIAGAVDIASDERATRGANALRPFSPSGRARPFAASADGAVPGEGAAAVVLKRLEDAVRDGDRLYAVIRGIGSSVGSGHIGAPPEVETYISALERAHEDAKFDPALVDWIEAHGSGDPGEDAVEAEALEHFFGRLETDTPCAMGSAKGTIGHTGAAAGLASIVKAALCLREELLPPLPGPRPLRVELERSGRLYAPRKLRYWLRDRARGPRRVGVSAMGIDGSCIHVCLEGVEPTAPLASEACEPTSPARSVSPAVFALGAPEIASLREELDELRAFAARRQERPVESLASEWLATRRGVIAQNPFCAALVAQDTASLAAGVEAATRRLLSGKDPAPQVVGAHGTKPATFHWTPEPLGRSGRVAFVFPGSGSQLTGMGRDLAATWPDVLRTLDRKNLRLASQMAHGRLWEPRISSQACPDHCSLILAQVSLGAAISDLVRFFGVEPQAAIGYSLGESTSLFALEAWRERDEMLRRIEASTLFTDDLAGPCEAARRAGPRGPRDRGDWRVGVGDRPAVQVRASLLNFPRAYLLIVNSPHECVIGGDRSAVDRLVKALGAGFLPLEGVTTVHCEVAREVADAYRSLHLFDTTPPEGVTFYSAAWGHSYVPTREAAADSILAQAVQPFDFTKGIESAHNDGVRIFLEVGPGSSTTRMVGKILAGRPHVALATCPGTVDEVTAFLRFLASCLAEGLPVNLERLYPPASPPSASSATARTPGATMTVRCGTLLDAPTAPAPAAPAPATPPRVLAPSLQRIQRAGVPSTRGASLAERCIAAQSASMAAEDVFQRTRALGLRTIEQVAALRARVQSAPAASRQREALLPTLGTNLKRQPFLDRAQCLEFAAGAVANVLGPRFAPIDAHPTRVRLPSGPLMLVDRILSIEGEPLSMTPGRVVTEHDVTPDRWYLDCGRIPVSVAVEAGQADLFLSGYLGIDLETRGLAVYRLLDAVVTFHRGLPSPGEKIHYDIRIERFFRQGPTWLFRFRFDASIQQQPFLTMENGCAGFFTQAELGAGKGIVHTALDRRPGTGKRPNDWRPLVPMAVESFDDFQVSALRGGDLSAGFGPSFSRLGLRKPVTLPSGKLTLVDRVESLNPTGGRYGLGLIRAEMDIHPDDWFLTCHFVDDPVMPGTLMYECCLHTLRIFLLRMGWVGETGTVAYEPVPNQSSQLKCRGQVVASTRKVTYEVTIRELGYRPEPYALADALMYADGKPIVEILGMSVCLKGLTRAGIEAMWQEAAGAAAQRPEGPRRPALFDEKSILAFAVGKPSEAFGTPYQIFDSKRVIARLPGPPYQFLDRIVEVRNARPFVMQAGGPIEAEYDVPPAAWYFEANRSSEMPFCVLLEAALQPCGWFSAYVGSALTSPTDVSYRNLGGSAIKLAEVTRTTGTLTTRVQLTKVSQSGGMIIQHFDFEMRSEAGPVYRGNTYFGFFSKTALAQQVGIRDTPRHTPDEAELRRAEAFAYPEAPPFPDARLCMSTQVDAWIPQGGPHRLGFIRGSKPVDASEWFFKAHFLQDPVWPGSLGLESFLQLLKAAAARRWGSSARDSFLTPSVGEKHEWIYRGQVLPTNKRVEVEAVLTKIDDSERLLGADGFLSRDGLPIYQLKGFTLRMLRL